MVALEAALQFEDTKESMQAFCVGQYMEVLYIYYGIMLLITDESFLVVFTVNLYYSFGIGNKLYRI